MSDFEVIDIGEHNRMKAELEDAQKKIEMLEQPSPYAQPTTGMELLQKLSPKRSVIDRRPLGETKHRGDE